MILKYLLVVGYFVTLVWNDNMEAFTI